MFPLIIKYSPRNRATSVPIEPIIRIDFDGYIRADNFPGIIIPEESKHPKQVSRASIKLYQINDVNQEVNIKVGYAIEEIGDEEDQSMLPTKCIIINPLTPLEHLSQYKLVISNVYSCLNEKMQGEVEINFTTVAGSPKVDEIPPIITEGPYIERSLPVDGSILRSNKIKVQMNVDIEAVEPYVPIEPPIDQEEPEDPLDGELDPPKLKIKLYLYEGTSIDDFEFFDHPNLLDGVEAIFTGKIVSIEPLGLLNFKKYTLIIKDENNKEIDHITFTRIEQSVHATADDVLSSKAVTAISEGIVEEDILRLLEDNTVLAKYLIEKSGSSISITEKSVVMSEYIKYKTQYDIVFDRFIELSANPTSKKLKDLEIKYGWALKDILSLLNLLKSRYLEWELALQEKASIFARAAVFIPGEDIDEVPEYKNRQLKDIEGAQSW